MVAGDTHLLPFSESEGTHSLVDVTRRLHGAIERVKTRRVNVAPNSRVVQWLDALSKPSATDRRSVLVQMIPHLQAGSGEHPFKDSFRALVEARMFIEIVDQLESQLTRSDLRDLVSGNFDPAKDLPSSRTRDREFELFTGALCQRAGLAVKLTEPDIVIGEDGQRVIAAKRLSSPSNVAHNIRRASHQVAKWQLPGFIVFDITRILDPDYVVVTHWTTAAQTVGGPILAFKNTEHRAKLTIKRNDHVLGIVLRAAFPHISRDFCYGTNENWWAVPIEGTDPAELNRFLCTILRGSEGS